MSDQLHSIDDLVELFGVSRLTIVNWFRRGILQAYVTDTDVKAYLAKQTVHNPAAEHCCAMTRDGKPCPIGADRIRNGKQYCDVHDPEGRFRQQYPLKK